MLFRLSDLSKRDNPRSMQYARCEKSKFLSIINSYQFNTLSPLARTTHRRRSGRCCLRFNAAVPRPTRRASALATDRGGSGAGEARAKKCPHGLTCLRTGGATPPPREPTGLKLPETLNRGDKHLFRLVIYEPPVVHYGAAGLIMNRLCNTRWSIPRLQYANQPSHITVSHEVHRANLPLAV